MERKTNYGKDKPKSYFKDIKTTFAYNHKKFLCNGENMKVNVNGGKGCYLCLNGQEVQAGMYPLLNKNVPPCIKSQVQSEE